MPMATWLVPDAIDCMMAILSYTIFFVALTFHNQLFQTPMVDIT
jgi:hypothetical protein